MRIVFATGNKNKLEELKAVMPLGLELVGLEEVGITTEIPEDHETLQENAIQKAQFVFDHTSCTSFADDTGLEIDALDGAPGVFSARYAGPQKNARDNMEKVLNAMQGKLDRKARFRTVIALVGHSGVKTFEGVVEGTILNEERGENGFGYDPIFQPEGEGRSFAEMALSEKNTISHRARAFRKLIDHLEASKR